MRPADMRAQPVVNLCPYPSIRDILAGWSTGSANAQLTPSPDGAIIDLAVDFPANSNLIYQTGAIITAPGDWRSASILATVPDGYPGLQVSVLVYEYGNNIGLSPLAGPATTILPGQTVRVTATPDRQAPAGSTGVRILLRARGTGAPKGARLIVADATLTPTREPVSYFPGVGYPERSGGGDWSVSRDEYGLAA